MRPPHKRAFQGTGTRRRRSGIEADRTVRNGAPPKRPIWVERGRSERVAATEPRMSALGGKRTFTFGASAPHIPSKFRLVGYAQV